MRLLRSARLYLLALFIAVAPIALAPPSAHASVFISVGFAPPILPVYEQPICPEPDLMWTPGYWAYGPDGYYWVPGAWVPVPYVGALWTPGYWGWSGGLYLFHEGYWGDHIGYYGGVNYGFGYMGIGFAGGEWRGGHFAYNTAVMHVNTTVIHNTYINQTIVHNTTIVNDKHVAYNGGPGGISHQPTAEEQTALHENHLAPTKFQQQHVQTAQTNKTSYFKNNGGHPQTLVAAKPLAAESHPAPAPHAAGPATHGAPQALNGYAKPAPNSQTAHPLDSAHPASAAHPAPEYRPVPESHPAAPAPRATPETRPTPESHAAPPSHPAPEAHPAPRPESHPAPKSEPKPKGR
jgi:hypothetical protein